MAKKPALQVIGGPAPPLLQPPRPLGEQGLSLWNRIQSEYEVHDAAGIELLLLACEALDRVARLRQQIDLDGEVVRVHGVPKAHPALRDELGGRALIARLLRQLGLDVQPILAPGRPPKGW